MSMDFIIKLPLSNGYDSILTITDHNCTKAIIFNPCNKSITAEGVAKLYQEHVFKCVGLLQTFIHDWDTWFMSSFAVKMCQALNIKQNTSMAFHPRTDGQAKRTNQKLEQFLKFYRNAHQNSWAQFLSLAEFAFNSFVTSQQDVLCSTWAVLLFYPWRRAGLRGATKGCLLGW